jgi:hypothetical protein
MINLQSGIVKMGVMLEQTRPRIALLMDLVVGNEYSCSLNAGAFTLN